MKKCNTCKINKEDNEYNNKGKCKKCCDKAKEYYKNNKEQIIKREKEYYKKIKKNIYEQNREKILKKQREYHKNKIKNNRYRVFYNIKKVNNQTKRNKNLKFNDLDILGCSIENLLLWIEFQFDHYMNWNNYGDYWTIDHVIPRFCIKDLESAERILNWKNLRPLEKEENREKWHKLLQEEIDHHEEIYYDFLFSKE